MDPARPGPDRRRQLLASWRSWIDSELDRSGPAWLQWFWTLLCAAAIALAFTLMGLAASSRLRADAWLDGGRWWRWYRANFVVSLTIAVLIHLLLTALVPWVGRERIRAWAPGRRALFFTGVPLLGVLLDWPLGVWLVGRQGPGWVRLDSYALIGSAAIGLVISLGIFLVFNARAQKAEAEQRAAEAQLRLLQAQMEPHFLTSCSTRWPTCRAWWRPTRRRPGACSRPSPTACARRWATCAAKTAASAPRSSRRRPTCRCCRCAWPTGCASRSGSTRRWTTGRCRRCCCSRWSRTRSSTGSSRGSRAARSRCTCVRPAPGGRSRCATSVVFVTAYDECAVQAFEQQALAAPPADEARLAAALRRLLPQALPDVAGAAGAADTPPPRLRWLRWLRAGVGERTRQIAVGDVICFRADDK